VEQVNIMKSDLRITGPVYTAISNFKLQIAN